MSQSVAAVESSGPVKFNLDEQLLENALIRYSEQAGVQVVFSSDLVEGLISKPVSGFYSPAQGLEILLADSGLEFYFTYKTTVVIRPKSKSEEVVLATPKKGLIKTEKSIFSQQANRRKKSSSASMEEVLVTARKRTESLQSVPIAISAWQGEQLEEYGVTQITDLFGRIPNLYFTQSGGAGPTTDFTYLVLRGVGFNGGLEPATGVFIDGMYQPQIGYDIGFLDLERLEVLRGPQGTLFGRNTQAGAINMVTRKPSKLFEGKVEAEVAEFSTRHLRGALGGEMADDLFSRINIEYSESDGYLDNRFGGESPSSYQKKSVRSVLLWQPKDNLGITLIADASRKDFSEVGFGVPLDCSGCYQTLYDNDNPDGKKSDGLQLNIEWSPSNKITFNSITGSRIVTSDISYDPDAHQTDQAEIFFPAVTQSTSEPVVPISFFPGVHVAGTYHETELEMSFLSQEFRFSGNFEQTNWLAGLYYFDQTIEQERLFDIGPGVPFVPLSIRENFSEQRDGWALFGQLSVNPVDKLELTLGGRYTKEKMSVSGERVLFILDNDLNGDGIAQLPTDDPNDIDESQLFAFPKTGSESFANFTGMFSAAYRFQENAQAYFSVSQGWKAGGINRFPSRDSAILPYDSEESINYELGLKAGFFENRLKGNLAFYRVDIKQQQMLVVIPDSEGSTPVTAIFNAAKSHVEGVELEVDMSLTDSLSLSLMAATVNSEFDDFIQTSDTETVNRSGDSFESTPDFIGSITVNYQWPLQRDDMSVHMLLDYRYIGGYSQLDTNYKAPLATMLDVPGYDRLDFRLAVEFSNGWRFTGYVKNALNSDDYNSIYRDQFADYPIISGKNRDLYVQALSPRQFGLRVTRHF